MLVLKNISFSRASNLILDALDLVTPSDAVTAVIGESGSGKSTLLQLIYGLLDAGEGLITWNNEIIQGPKYHLVPGMSFIKYLAQDFDLMPFTSVQENIGHYISNLDLEYKNKKVNELLELIEMPEFANTKVRYLSGGQMQRVALAKVLATPPELLLLDEPFSHLDFFQKKRLSHHLFDYLKDNEICCLFATHDPSEALMYADQIVVLNKGKIAVQGTPESVYQNTKNRTIAHLFGTVNRFPEKWLAFHPHSEDMCYARPEELEVSNEGILCRVQKNYYQGNQYLIVLEKDNYFIEVYHHSELIIGSQTYIQKKFPR